MSFPLWHEKVLNEREKKLKEDKDEFIDWSKAKDNIRLNQLHRASQGLTIHTSLGGNNVKCKVSPSHADPGTNIEDVIPELSGIQSK